MNNKLKLSDTVEVLTVAMTQWPHLRITEPLARLWHEAFKNFSKDEFWQAIIQTLKTKKTDFPISIGEVNRTLLDLRKLTQSKMITEGEAWRLVITAVKRFGLNNKKEAHNWLRAVDDKVAEAVKILNWETICFWQQKDEPINRAHFFRIYTDLVEREDHVELMGIELPKNSALGYKKQFLLEE